MVDNIVSLLTQERDKLDRVIEILNGVRRRGRPRKFPTVESQETPAVEHNGTHSEAARKARSLKMKAYWAKRRRAKAKA